MRSSTEIIISELILIGGPIPLLVTNVISVLAQTPYANYRDNKVTQDYVRQITTHEHTHLKRNKWNHNRWHWVWTRVELLNNNNNNNNNNNTWKVKAKVVPGGTAEPFQNHWVRTWATFHESTKFKNYTNSYTGHCTHIADNVKVKVHIVFQRWNNITCRTNCK
jgi:hypothetical protein